MNLCMRLFGVVGLALSWCLGAWALDPAVPASLMDFPDSQRPWSNKVQGAHIMAMNWDRQGRLWVCTEGKGVWCWDGKLAQAKAKDNPADPLLGWTQFTRATTGGEAETQGAVLTTGTPAQQAFGDNCVYACACDHKGRMWIGHLNHGVSVYDGRAIPETKPEAGYPGWRNYDALSGPLGERVFDIAVSPEDGDVWIATNLGLSRYRDASDTWTHYTRQDGLPYQVQCLAFLKDGSGTLLVGTQCDGLVIGIPVRGPTLEYPTWRQVTTPPERRFELPLRPMGTGLPSPLINDILASHNGNIYVATPAGLAVSADRGESWNYLRGRDWEARALGLATPPSEAELKEARALLPAGQPLLLEDYCTCLEETSDGLLWIGHWREGLEAWAIGKDPQGAIPRWRQSKAGGEENDKKPNGGIYVRALAQDAWVGILVGFYGEGFANKCLNGESQWQQLDQGQELAPQAAGLPSSDRVKPPKELRPKLDQWLAAQPKDLAEKGGGFVGEDWMTGGDNWGRYGQSLSVYCGGSGWGQDKFPYLKGFEVADGLGFHPKDAHGPFRWAWELNVPNNRRILYNPRTGRRTPAGWNNGSERIPITVDGTDYWISFKLPEGTHRLSLYFENYDGQLSHNRFRDYLLTLHPDGPSMPPVAWTRVRDWHQGVYKSFVVQGPGNYHLKLARNGSFNIMVMGVMVDPVAMVPVPAKYETHLRYQYPNQKIPVLVPAELKDKAELDPWKPWLDDASLAWFSGVAPASARLLLRSCGPDGIPASPEFQALLRWHARLWTQEDRAAFDKAMGI